MNGRVVLGVVAMILGCGGAVEAPVTRAPLVGNVVPLRLAVASSGMAFPLDVAAINGSPMMTVDGNAATVWQAGSGAKVLFEFDRGREVTGLRLLPCVAPVAGTVKIRLFDDDSDGAYERKPWTSVAVEMLADGWVGGELGGDATEAIAAEVDAGDRGCLAEIEILTSERVTPRTGTSRWRLARSSLLPAYVPSPAPKGDVPTDVSESPCDAGWTDGDGDEARVIALEASSCRRDGSKLLLEGSVDGAPWERTIDVVEVSVDLRVYGGFPFTSQF